MPLAFCIAFFGNYYVQRSSRTCCYSFFSFQNAAARQGVITATPLQVMIITLLTVALLLAVACYCLGGFAAKQTWTHQTYNLAGAAGVMHFVIDLSRDGFLFPSIRKGVVSDSALSKHMRDKNLAGVPHGFRSILQTRLMDNNDISFEVTEMIVAHRTSSKVALAYTRTDYIDQRSHYMEK